MMRRRGPGLIRTAATTAVIAGTATAVSGKVARHQQQKAYEKEQARYGTQSPPAQAQPEATPSQSEEPQYMAELQRLAQLKNQGIITEDEFQAKKKQILGV